MIENEKVVEFNRLVDQIKNTDPTSYLNNQMWGTINFGNSTADVERLQLVLKEFPKPNITALTDRQFNQLHSALVEVANSFNEIGRFSIEQQNPHVQRDEIVKQLKQRADKFIVQLTSVAGLLSFTENVSEEFEQRIRKSIEESEKKIRSVISDSETKVTEATKSLEAYLENSETRVNSQLAEIDLVLEAAKEASAVTGVAVFAGNFDDEFDVQYKASLRWLGTSAFLLTVTLIAIFQFNAAMPIVDWSDTAKVFQVLTTKFLVLGLLFSAIVWCSGLYRSTKHQATVNKHKANALKTFRSFVEATDDPAVRDAVLLETTRSIFSLAPTGYLSGSKEPHGDTKMVEIVKTVAEQTKQ